MLYAIVIMPFIIWLISLLLLFYAPPLYKSASHWIADVLVIKDYNFQQRDKNKNNMFFISGSNGLFGISSKVLEEKLNYNIHNLGTNAGLPLLFYLNLAKKYAQNGDIIIAPFEYGCYRESGDLNLWIYDQLTTWGMPYQSLLSPEMQKKLFWKNIYSYWERLPFFYRTLPITEKEILIAHTSKNIFSQKAYHGLSLTQHGEMFIDSLPQKFSEFDYLSSDKANQYFIDELTKFNTYAKEHGIKFYVTYPVSQKNKFLDTDTLKTQELLKNYEQVFNDAGVNFFGTNQFYNLKTKYFYDTSYHLNATGAVLRSLLLAEDINTYVLGKKSSYLNDSEESTQEFFKQKEKEALKIMVKLRKEDKK